MPKGDFINVDIKDARLKKAFATLIKRGKNMQPLTAQIAGHLYTLTDEAFAVESAYDGTPWARLADSTIEAKGHNVMLHVKEGRIRERMTMYSDNTSAVVGTNVVSDGGYPFPAVHQFGSEHVPARPYLPFDEHGVIYDTVIDDILLMVGDYLEEGL